MDKPSNTLYTAFICYQIDTICTVDTVETASFCVVVAVGAESGAICFITPCPQPYTTGKFAMVNEIT
jgi:hypothetical protein